MLRAFFYFSLVLNNAHFLKFATHTPAFVLVDGMVVSSDELSPLPGQSAVVASLAASIGSAAMKAWGEVVFEGDLRYVRHSFVANRLLQLR